MVTVTDIVRDKMSAARGKISEQVSEFYLRFLYDAPNHLEVTPYLIESGERAKLPVTGSRVKKALTKDFVSPNIYLESQFGDTLDEAFAPLYFQEEKELSQAYERFNHTLNDIKRATFRGITDKAMQSFRDNTAPLTARENILSAFDAKTKRLPALAEDANYQAIIERLIQEYINVGVTRFVIMMHPRACKECQKHLEKVYTADDRGKFPEYHPNCRCVMVPADENGQPLFPFGSNEEPRMFGGREGQPKPSSNEWDSEDYIDYIRRSINQIILGSYTDDVTALGTLGQIGLGFTGLDLPADVREVSHDITNWQWTWGHAGETALDVIGLIPVLGALKNADEAAELVTGALKHSDELLSAGVKHGDELVDAAQGGFRHGDEVLRGAGKLKPQALMDDLAKSGVKYNPDDVVMVTKIPDGRLLWLETGSNSAGLKHIVDGHATNFADKGITDIPSFLNQTLQNAPINTGMGTRGLFADYLINGSTYRVAYGTNGFIVSFYPIK